MVTNKISLKCDKCHDVRLVNTLPQSKKPTINPDGLNRCIKCPCHTSIEVNNKGVLVNNDGSEKTYYNIDGRKIGVRCRRRCLGTYRQFTQNIEKPEVANILTTTNRYSENRTEVLNYESFYFEGFTSKRIMLEVDNTPKIPKWIKVKTRIQIPEVFINTNKGEVQQQDKDGNWKSINCRARRKGVNTPDAVTYGFDLGKTLMEAFTDKSHNWVKIPIFNQ